MTLESTIAHFYRELSGTIGVFQGIRFFIAPTIDEACYYALGSDVERHNFAHDLMESNMPSFRWGGFNNSIFGILRQAAPPLVESEEQVATVAARVARLEQDIATASQELHQAEERLRRLEGSRWDRIFKKDEIADAKHRLWNCKVNVVHSEREKEFYSYWKKAADQYQSRFSSEPADALIHYGNGLNGPMPGEQRNPSCFFYLIGRRSVADEFMDIAARDHLAILDIIKGLVAKTPYAALTYTYETNRLHNALPDPENKFLRSEDLRKVKEQATFYQYPPRVCCVKDDITGTTNVFR